MGRIIEIDDDLAEAIERLAHEKGASLSELAGEVLREGLRRSAAPGGADPRDFKLETVSVGRPLRTDLDDVSAVIEEIEGPWHR